MERKTGSSSACLTLALLAAAGAALAIEPARGQSESTSWNAEAIIASRVVLAPATALPAQPVVTIAPGHLTLAVEPDYFALIDDTAPGPIARIAARDLHGAPAFSPDGRFLYWATRSGWINQFDLSSLQPVARIRVGVIPRSLAVSSNGRYLMVANEVPATLVALDARDLSLVKVTPGMDQRGEPSPFSAVVDVPRRNSFIVALTAAPELWEIPYDGRAVYKGLVHDYRLKEAIAEPGPLPARVIALDAPLADFLFAPGLDVVIGRPLGDAKGHVIHLAVGRKIADVEIGSAARAVAVVWERVGNDGQPQRLLGVRGENQPLITVIDTRSWKTVRTLRTSAPGRFLRSHERSPYLWADAAEDGVDLIDKRSLEAVTTLRPGGRVADVEFDDQGRYAMLALHRANDGLVVYDARTREEIRRLPLEQPAGLYNVWNKSPRPAASGP